jgi:ribonuclease HI
LTVYTDGGVYSDDNLVKWAFIVVENDEDIIHQETGELNGGGEHNHDVERAESEALFRACEWCKSEGGNYRLYTDSKSMLDKIQNRVPNATKNPHVKGIQTILKEIKSSPLPSSLTIEWLKRRSNRWMQTVDDYCEKTAIGLRDINDLPRIELPPKGKAKKPTVMPKPDYHPAIHVLDF